MLAEGISGAEIHTDSLAESTIQHLSHHDGTAGGDFFLADAVVNVGGDQIRVLITVEAPDKGVGSVAKVHDEPAEFSRVIGEQQQGLVELEGIFLLFAVEGVVLDPPFEVVHLQSQCEGFPSGAVVDTVRESGEGEAFETVAVLEELVVTAGEAEELVVVARPDEDPGLCGSRQAGQASKSKCAERGSTAEGGLAEGQNDPAAAFNSAVSACRRHP